MPDGFRYDTRGLDDLEAKLAKLIELVVDLRPFWPKVIPLYMKWVAEQFAMEGDFFGDPWAELSPNYAAWKSKHYPGKGILVAEYDLKRAVQYPRRVATPTTLILEVEPYHKTTRSTDIHPGGKRSRARVQTDKVMDPDWFQEGTDRMPARPILPLHDELPPQAVADVGAAADAWLEEMTHRLGIGR